MTSLGARELPIEPESSPVHLQIRPSHGWARIDLGELWRYRELIYFLTVRDITVRYKQTILGALWAIIQPLLTMIVFSLFFGRLAGVSSDGAPYPLFSFTALVPWTFFANSITAGSNSLVQSANLLKKVYFPRLALPLSAILGVLVDFVLAFGVLLLIMIGYGVPITLQALWVIPLSILALVAALGVSLWLAAMNVQYRDVRYAVPFLTQLWMFLTPVAYPSSLIENETLRSLYAINPMVGVIEGFRWALLDTGTAPGPMILVSTVVALLILLGGLFYFRRMEDSFADVV